MATAEQANSTVVSFDNVVDWCTRCPELVHDVAKSYVDEGLDINEVFVALEQRLCKADTFIVADGVLEVLSILCMASEDHTRTEKLIEFSWTALHTVYSHEGHEIDSKGLPFALAKASSHLMMNTLSNDVAVLQNIVEMEVNKLNVQDTYCICGVVC